MKQTTGLLVPALLLLAASASAADTKTAPDVRRSVVRVLATQRAPNVLKP